MTWITENPWLIFVTCLFLCVVVSVLYVNTQKKVLLIYAIVFGVIAVGSIVVEQMIVTDREEVEELVRKLARDVRDNNMDGILDSVVGDAEESRKAIQQLMPQCEFRLCSVSSRPEFEFLNDSSAVIYFPVFVQVSESPYGPGSSKVEIKLELVKRGGKWLIQDYGYKLPMQGEYSRL